MQKFENLPLLNNIKLIHTTAMGLVRLQKNLHLDPNEVIQFCINCIHNAHKIERIGKNWYVYFNSIKITINAHNYCIITAHILKDSNLG